MHVLIIPSWFSRGEDDPSGTFFHDQAIAIADHSSIKVGMIFPDIRSPKSLIEYRRQARTGQFVISNPGYTLIKRMGIYAIPHYWPSFISAYVRIGMLLFEEYVRVNGLPDVIHVHAALPAGLLAMRISSVYGRPFVLSEHSSLLAQDIHAERELAACRRVVEHAAAASAVSSAFCSHLKGLVGSPKGGWQTIPNSVADHFLTYPLHGDEPNQCSQFVCVGYMNENKNFASAVLALEIVRETYKNATLAIVGEGPTRLKLQSLIHDRGLQEHATLLGQLSHKRLLPILSKAAALVLPSLSETFGVVIVEAMGLGVPAITSKTFGPSSIIQDGMNGFIVDIPSPEKIACAMISVLSGVPSIERARLRQECKSRYASATTARRWIEVYDNVVASQPSK